MDNRSPATPVCSTQFMNSIFETYPEGQWIRALIDCGAPSLLMAPPLLLRLGLLSEPAYITSSGLDNQVRVSV
jgi:hypothetical protein